MMPSAKSFERLSLLPAIAIMFSGLVFLLAGCASPASPGARISQTQPSKEDKMFNDIVHFSGQMGERRNTFWPEVHRLGLAKAILAENAEMGLEWPEDVRQEQKERIKQHNEFVSRMHEDARNGVFNNVDVDLICGRFLHEGLQTEIPQLDFTNLELQYVLQFVGDVTGLRVIVDWDKLKNNGVDKHTFVNLHLVDSTVKQVLDGITSNLGKDKFHWVAIESGTDSPAIRFTVP